MKHGAFRITYDDYEMVTFMNMKGVDWWELQLDGRKNVMKVEETHEFDRNFRPCRFKEVQLSN